MLLDGLASDLVVHERCNVVLQTRMQFIDDGLVGSFLTLLFQQQVHLDDLLVGVGQVVLTAHRA